MSDKKIQADQGTSLALSAMAIIGIISAVIVGSSFFVIRYWPLPVSVAPYFGFREGAAWGLIAGGVCGLILGWLTDDKHFTDANQ